MTKYIIILLVVYISCFSSRAQAQSYRFPSSKKLDFRQDQTVKIKNLGSASIINFNLRQMTTKKSKLQSFSQLSFKNFDLSKEEGLPEVPYKSFIISGNINDILVKVDLGRKYSFDKIKTLPAKGMPCRCSKDAIKKAVYKFNKYHSRGKQLYKTTKLGKYRGESLFLITFFLANTSENGTFELYPEVGFQVRSKTNKKVFVFNDDTFNETLLNENRQNKNLILIGRTNLLEGAKDYIEYKKENGFTVHSYSLESIGESRNEIKAFIAGLYESLQMSYVLLLGDEDLFPTFFLKTSNHPETPTDISYFLMDGAEDRIPDVLYGRITGDTKELINKQLMKSIFYEKTKNISKNIIGIASDEGADPSDIEYMDQMLVPLIEKLNMREVEFYQNNTRSTAVNINKSLSRGAVWLNYIGHGTGDRWPSINKGSYTTTNVNEIDIQKSLPVIIDVACQNGRYSNDNRLGMKFMNISKIGTHKGATAYYGGTVDVSWHPPALMAVGINKYLSKKTIHSLGEVLFLGQLHLITHYDESEAALENLVWYNLQGDPSLSLKALFN